MHRPAAVDVVLVASLFAYPARKLWAIIWEVSLLKLCHLPDMKGPFGFRSRNREAQEWLKSWPWPRKCPDLHYILL